MRLMRLIFLAGVWPFLFSHSSMGAGNVSVLDNSFLRDGKIWVARGVSIVGRTAPVQLMKAHYKRAHDLYGSDELQSIKAFGADLIRFQVSQGGADPSSPIYSFSYLQEVFAAVRLARSEGFSVVVCVDSQGPSGLSEHGMPSESTMRAWGMIAPLFSGDNGVLFELFNEPAPREDMPATGYGWVPWQQAMQRIVDQIRRAGARNVLLLDGLDWGRTLKGVPEVIDPIGQTALAIHPYYTGYLANDSGRDQNFGSLRKTHAILATEWDASSASHSCVRELPQYAESTLKYLRVNSIGLIEWAFDYPNTLHLPSGELTNYEGYACSMKTGFGPGTLVQAYFTNQHMGLEK